MSLPLTLLNITPRTIGNSNYGCVKGYALWYFRANKRDSIESDIKPLDRDYDEQ